MPKRDKIKKSKITLDKLALMVGKGFNEVHKRIDNIKIDIDNIKIDVIELKLDVKSLKTKVDDIDKKFDNTIGKQDGILKRVENLETDNKMDILFRRRVEEDIDKLKNKVVVLETKVKK